MNTEHCSCCDGNQKLVEDLKVANQAYRQDAKDAEKKYDGLNEDLIEAQNNADLAEKERDDAEELKDSTAKALLEEKQKHLDALRGFEFCLDGICKVCLDGVEKHAIGCKLKLEIFRLSMELNRSGILRLGRVW